MPTTSVPTSTAAPSVVGSLQLPVAAIICIAIGAYVVVVIIILVIRQCLVSRGFCAECGKSGSEDEQRCCGGCCTYIGERCNCGKAPSREACLDRCCPNRKNMTCGDFITCQCCVGCKCCGDEPLCNCGNCDCACACQPWDCDTINCLCCELRVKDPPPPDEDADS